MSEKPYRLGVTVGRFQTFHSGHEYMLQKAIDLCDTVGVFVGSSQESGTLKNPFSYETRENMLKTVFGDKIRVYPLPDIGVGNNTKWGEYVLKNILDRFGSYPDLLVSGKEERRLNWFDGESGFEFSELYVPKIIDISATTMRNHFLGDNLEEWKRYTNPKLWDEYQTLREAVISAKDNLDTASL